MKALVFAAGLGERMRPLTESTPKPLLSVGGKRLIEWHLEKLAAVGVDGVVVNTSWLADQFPQVLGNGSRWGLHIHYAYEGSTPLETGGGMCNALQWLGDAPFIAVNGDIWCDVNFASLPREPEGDAHLLLVDNPVHNPRGDFALGNDDHVHSGGDTRLTFSGIGMYRASLLTDWRAVIGDVAGTKLTPPRFKLAPLLRAAMARGAVTGAHHRGRWTDVGTPERLQLLDEALTTEVQAVSSN
ncbi:N-acetylmuramate alpha-1-phosphate uridylyltransferase MurU [Thermomonas sp.]|uniref:N-acetylmuramate alpha-1-phosphate uridylyltransferase MurU n=1 Tax=Thermomonas sp. TaxID=1971895 RepID=UPI002489205A|nr:nucleotidyltransferase family protein [Thermomonas sp.]MDI1251906.1 nucleotidyltransferase family protein [Thermomonas sp.]